MTSQTQTPIVEQYLALPKEKKLVILHPMARNEHRFLEQYLLSSKAESLYISLAPPLNSPHDVLTRIAEAFALQYDTNYSIESKPDTATQQIVDALFEAGCSNLYLDDFDGKSAATIFPIIQKLIPLLNDEQRIIINGRWFFSAILDDPTLAEQSQLLPIDHSRLIIDYIHPEEEKTSLEVRAFGQGRVFVNGRPIDKWEGFLPRALFHYFVDRAMITRHEIFETFWPKLPKRDATNVFHVTKRKINELLDINLTVYGSGFYRISHEIDLQYDVVLFQVAVQNAAIADDDEAMKLYRQAIDLYQGDMLSGLEQSWIIRRRDEMRSTYIDALSGLARILQDRQQDDEALGLFLRAASLTPSREDIARHIMEMYMNMEAYQHAYEAFRKLEDALKAIYNVPPDPQTMALAHYIKEQLNLL